MASTPDWQIAPPAQPDPADYRFDLARALGSVVSLRATVPDDAFTASVLGTERSGNGVIIRKDGLVLTIGYLITEAETIWLGLGDGRVVQGHALGFDQQTGFGLVQALARLDLPALSLGSSKAAKVGERTVVAGAGGRARSVAARVVAKQEFAGYWEYVLDEAIFTAPAHPYWGGTALIGPAGDLLGIGSLRLEQAAENERETQLNMIVPIDLLTPVLDDILHYGGPRRPARPWLGLYAVEVDEGIVIAGLADRGPATRAGVQANDVLIAVDGREPNDLADFFRSVWALGEAGVAVPLTVGRDGEKLDVKVISADRNAFLKVPRMH